MGDRHVVLVFDSRNGFEVDTRLPDGYHSTLWRPSWSHPVPPGESLPSLYLWWLMHQLHGFRNRSYAALIVHAGVDVAHRSVIFPRSFVFPFMGLDDLQIGLVSTAEPHQRRGLAKFAIRDIVRRLERPGRRFWYLTEESNEASIRAACAAGLILAGAACKHRRLGFRPLGSFELLPPRSAAMERAQRTSISERFSA